MIRVYPYKSASKSAKSLSNIMGIKRIKHNNSRYNGGGIVINWGATRFPIWERQTLVLNYPLAVVTSTNKLHLFNLIHNNNLTHNNRPIIPDFCDNINRAREMIRDGNVVLCRTLLSSHSGRGIVVAETEEQLVEAPLYTRYLPKKLEYRIHLGKNPETNHISVIDCQQKIRDPNKNPTSWKVRSHDNGFIYVRNNIHLNPDILKACVQVFQISGLDFGAIDVIYNEKRNEINVLEINTAPGLEGQTVNSYAEFFNNVGGLYIR